MECNLSGKTFACVVRQKSGEKKNRNVMYETYVDFYPGLMKKLCSVSYRYLTLSPNVLITSSCFFRLIMKKKLFTKLSIS